MSNNVTAQMKRLRLYELGTSDLVSLIRTAWPPACLPADSVLVDVCICWDGPRSTTVACVIKVHSDEFHPVPEGDLIPTFYWPAVQ